MKGTKIDSSEPGVLRVCYRTSLIYIPDRLDVSPVCLKTYICVKGKSAAINLSSNVRVNGKRIQRLFHSPLFTIRERAAK